VKTSESDSIEIKSDLESCDVKIQDLTGALSLISLQENSYRIFKNIEGISCELVEEGVYINCSNCKHLGYKKLNLVRSRTARF
jgi:hypothetical protein